MPPESSSNQTDQMLIQRLNEGDGTAFDILYFRYKDWVMRLAWRFTGHEEDALDVLQETFSYFAKKFPGFRLSAALTTFLYPAVRNLSIAARRKRQKSAGIESDPEFFESPSPTSRLPHELDTVFAALSSAHREILLMRFVDDMTQPEIAEALSLPLGTVKSRLHHAIQAARQLPNIEEILSDGAH